MMKRIIDAQIVRMSAEELGDGGYKQVTEELLGLGNGMNFKSVMDVIPYTLNLTAMVRNVRDIIINNEDGRLFRLYARYLGREPQLRTL